MEWRKSSRSGSTTDCVELAWPTLGVAVRDSKNPQSILRVDRDALAKLVMYLR